MAASPASWNNGAAGDTHTSGSNSPGSGSGGGGTAVPKNWLAPLSPNQITKQATSSINTAYKPAYADLNNQTKLATGISDKRTSDNKVYQAWLDTQMAGLQSSATQASQQLTTMEQGLMADQKALYSGQAGTLIGDANARAGNVSNNATSNAFGERLAQAQTQNMGHLQDAELQLNHSISTGNDALSGARANNYGFMQAQQAKNIGDLSVTLAKIGDARTKLATQKTADISKEISRLQGVEIQKQQSNRDYAAAVSKLNLTGQIAQAKLAQSNTNNIRTTSTSANNNLLNNQTRSQLNADNNATRISIANARAAARANKPASPKDSNTIYSHIDKLSGLIDQVKSYGYTGSAAWHLLKTGGYVQIGTKTVTKGGQTKQVPITKYIPPNTFGDSVLNAAYNVAHNGGHGLTPGDVAWFKSLGIHDYSSRYTTTGLLNGNPATHISF